MAGNVVMTEKKLESKATQAERRRLNLAAALKTNLKKRKELARAVALPAKDKPEV
jgi:hypothetical protein